MSNPLQQYFRQPKIYIGLPSKGIYSKPGTYQGDVNRMPVFGMTGMDEIVLKTPDALLAGESTVSVIQSCCGSIKDAWEISNIDAPMILSAIRIATYGSKMSVGHTCQNCNAENEYELDLNKIIEHFGARQFDGKIVLKDLVINLQPLTYRQSNDFAMRNFALQRRLVQVREIEDQDQQQMMINQIYKELGDIQNDVYIAAIESVEIPNAVVSERSYIAEWLKNCDSDIFDAIKTRNDELRKVWEMPTFPSKCESCGTEVNLTVELDQASFFARA